MRGFAYLVAALAAIGIMIGIGSMPVATDNTVETDNQFQPDVNEVVFAQPGTLHLDVPDMHCEFACFPKVKETLESLAGVRSVELAEQQEEGVIDNRQVIVSHDAGFNFTVAKSRLAKEGFESELVP